MFEIPADHGVANLTRTQFTVVRAYLQGVPLDFIAGRYMALPGESMEHLPDKRVIQNTIQSYLHTLIRLAYQHNQGSLALLLEKGPASSGIGMQRVVDAVNTLERLGKIKPQPTHSVALWFAPALTRRFRRAGLVTIADIIALANLKGTAWWRSVPRIGEKAAFITINWLIDQQAQLGAQALADYVQPPRKASIPMRRTSISPNCTKVVPLEWINIPSPALDGSRGVNRAAIASRHLPIDTDLEAINEWLSNYPLASHTWRAYRREAERVILWAVVERGRALSDLTSRDCAAYGEFLLDPQPPLRWIGPMTQRSDFAWRPFQRRLSITSRLYALTVVNLMYRHLIGRGYFASNPWEEALKLYRTSSRRHPTTSADAETRRAFSKWLEQQTHLPGASGAQMRIVHAAWLLLSGSRVRREQLCALTCADFLFDPQKKHLLIELSEQNGKVSSVSLTLPAMNALQAHWKDRGLDLAACSTAAALSPLAHPTTARTSNKLREGRDGYSMEGLYRLLKAAIARFESQTHYTQGDGNRLTLRALRSVDTGLTDAG